MERVLIPAQAKLQQALNKRKEEALYRSLQVQEELIDFCSNDYLSFSRKPLIQKQTEQKLKELPQRSGSTGSRSISGNTAFAEKLEQQIANFHHAETGLLFNSGYDANVGLFSSLAQKDDTYICDELIHASIIDGCRLSYASRFRFAHNNLADLEKKLQLAKGQTFVVVESVYSMDGDQAPLNEIANLCERYGAALIVDEAHATGVFGKRGTGLVQHYGLEKKVFARIHTFGKALGGHGAIVVGSEILRNYLINFARSFIFTTALPLSSLAHIAAAYEHLASTDFDNSKLHTLILYFREQFAALNAKLSLINSQSPIQSVLVPGNENARALAKHLQQSGYDVRAILSPSVPRGKERLRISLHLHNSPEEIRGLLGSLSKFSA